MSKPIRSYPKNTQYEVAQRRVKNGSGGLGTISAKNWLERAGRVSKEETKKEE